MAVIFGTMHVVKKAGLESPEYVNIIRGAYGVVTVLLLGFTYYLKNTITRKNDTTALEYDDPSPSSQGDRIVTTNVKYDLGEVAKLQKSTLMTVAIVVFMHFKFGYVQPLILQTLLPALNTYKNQLFQIYVLGKPATDSLKRPWVPENPLAALTGASNSNSNSEGTRAAADANDNSNNGSASASDSASESEPSSTAKNKNKSKGKGKQETRKDK
ncbi:phosphate transporter (Pho88) [Coemansia spiralis]|uniref:Phosphate transporter (Pho88) n=1 Tax=Coemansia spiralis TaxID=417178 RepID=A0A9W8L063_9FUNG|nr:phosphate transporter (Pho88) [Coemansia spiralis]